MGIRHLNRFFQENASNGIKKIPFKNLSKKKIAIDISIYLYKFKSEDALIENIYLMISLFRHYNIIPLFVFDGPFPEEKRNLIKERRAQKKIALNRFNNLKDNLNQSLNKDEIMNIHIEMDKLKKSFIFITKNDIAEVKKLFDVYGVQYITAKGEAEQLCAKLVQKKIAWGCLSEDMDLFVYGCPRVLRYMSLINRTVIYYDLKIILKTLDLSLSHFKQICILSGTDYNQSNYSLFEAVTMFNKFKKSKQDNFHVWLKKKNYITDIEFYITIENLFDLNIMKVFDNISIKFNTFSRDDLQCLMKKHGFIYI